MEDRAGMFGRRKWKIVAKSKKNDFEGFEKSFSGVFEFIHP